MLSGKTADISEFAEFGWYDWVKFRDTNVPYPEDKLVLGRYLGPSTDIGPAMTAKILKRNGQTVHRTTLRALTEDEDQDQAELAARKSFDDLDPRPNRKTLTTKTMLIPTHAKTMNKTKPSRRIEMTSRMTSVTTASEPSSRFRMATK